MLGYLVGRQLVSVLPLFLLLVGTFTSISIPASAQSGASTQIQGVIQVGQREVFGLNATKGDTLNITLRWESPTNDLDIYLNDPKGNPAAKSTNADTNRESFQITANLTGRYLLLLISFGVPLLQVAYTLQSSIPLYHVVTLYRITVNLSGLTGERSTNVTSTFLGTSFTQSVSGAFIGYVDNGTTVHLLNTVAVSNDERFHTSDVTDWRVTSPTTVAVVFHEQVKPHITFDGLLSDFPSTVDIVADGHPGKVNSSTGWSDWVDRGSVVRVERTIQVTANRRFSAVGTNKWIANSSFEEEIQYYQQWKALVAITGLLDSNPIGITFLRGGQTLTQYVRQKTWSDWVDDGSLISLPDVALRGTGVERWATEQKDFIVRDSGPFLVQYTHQYRITLVVSGLLNGPTLLATVAQFTNSHEVPVVGPWSDWVDAGTEIKFPILLDNGLGTMWSTSSNGTYKVSDSGILAVAYTARYRMNLVFVTADGTQLPSPKPSSVDLVGPNGSALSITKFEGAWLDEGTWLVRSIIWKGTDIAPSTPYSFSPYPGGVRAIGTQVREVTLRVEDTVRVPVAGAGVQVSYPDGTVYLTVSDDEGYVRIPAIYPGLTVIRIGYLGQNTVVSGDYNQFTNTPIFVRLPLSTPTAALFALLAIVVIAILVAFTLSRRKQ